MADRHREHDTMLSIIIGTALAFVVVARIVATAELAAGEEGRAYFAAWFMEVGLWLTGGCLVFAGLLRGSWADSARGFMVGSGALALLLAPIAGGIV